MEVINAVEMVRKIRDKQFEETKDMSSEELISYFHKESGLAHEAMLKSKPKKTESVQ